MSIELLKKLNILYVEDEEELSTELIHNLKFFVNDIIYCKNGKEGLDSFYTNENNIDLIITDVLMPMLNGRDMVDKIRDTNKSVPIIYTTAFNDEEFIKYTQTQELVKNIAKPIDLEELVKCALDLTAN